MSSLYENTESYPFGMREVLCIDDGEQYYFDLYAILVDDEGGVWAARDSGCSCPAQWEEVTRGDITPLYTIQEAIRFLDIGVKGSSAVMKLLSLGLFDRKVHTPRHRLEGVTEDA